MADLSKLCMVCGKDCAGMPRTKDARGQYYHNECYKRLRDARQKKEAGLVEPAPPPLENFAAAPMSMMDEIIDEEVVVEASQRACSSCGSPLSANDVICINCGFNTQSGVVMKPDVKKAKKDRGSSSGSGFSMSLSPPIVSLIIICISCLMLVVANASGSEDMILLVRLAIRLVAITMIIFILVAAFMEGIGQGFLTLCVPFYIFYFLLGVTENQWAKYSFAVYFVTLMADYVIFGVGM